PPRLPSCGHTQRLPTPLSTRSHSSDPPNILPLLFFFRPTAPPAIYTLSLHDALPIYHGAGAAAGAPGPRHDRGGRRGAGGHRGQDRKSTRLNSSHRTISYAVFCLKKKNKHKHIKLLDKHRRRR